MADRMQAGFAAATVCRIGSACLALLFAGSAWAFDLEQLAGQLAQQRSGEARFTERRDVRGLDEPLLSSGTLSFAAPDRFVRRTLKPRPESMAVDGNTLTMTRGGRSRSFALDAAPELIGVVEAVRATLTGNADTLRRYFRPALTGDLANWTLELTPVDAKLGDQLRKVRITGRGGVVRGIEMELLGGDRSVMTIEPVVQGAAASAAPSGAAASAP